MFSLLAGNIGETEALLEYFIVQLTVIQFLHQHVPLASGPNIMKVAEEGKEKRLSPSKNKLN